MFVVDGTVLSVIYARVMSSGPAFGRLPLV